MKSSVRIEVNNDGVPPAAPNRTRALLDALGRPNEIPRANRVYANRNLRLDRVWLVGFDMDYTLALYDQPRMEDLSIVATIDKLIGLRGYPEILRSLHYDARMGIRGLVVDKETGNILKPDRYGSSSRGYHGTAPIDRAQLRELYQKTRLRLSNARFAFIDTLFALPEVVLYAAMVSHFDAQPGGGRPYPRMWEDIRECIDLAHSDGAIKNLIAKDLPHHMQRDPELAETLHKMRSSGKRLFLLTNSAWDYTDPVMRYLLDGTLSAYPSWRNFFDVTVVSAGKPRFFTEARPFLDLGPDGQSSVEMAAGPFQRGHVYAGGNLKDFEDRVGARGDRVLFVGDHIYGDMLRSRKSSAWRTAMVLQELEHEVAVHDRIGTSLEMMEQIERQLRQLDGDVEEKQHILRSLQKLDGGLPGDREVPLARAAAKDMVALLKSEQRSAMVQHTRLEQEIDTAFNPFWGPLFREGREVSKFGDQVEDYACVYTSRVSNFRFYSPMRHFRGPRDRMPHER